MTDEVAWPVMLAHSNSMDDLLYVPMFHVIIVLPSHHIIDLCVHQIPILVSASAI